MVEARSDAGEWSEQQRHRPSEPAARQAVRASEPHDEAGSGDGGSGDGTVGRAAGRAADDALVDRCRRGDREAFSELVSRYQDRLVNLIYRRVGNLDEAQDLAQEVFIRAYRAIPRFEGNSAFYTWLFRIAINTTITYRRRSTRRGGTVSLDHELRTGSDDVRYEPEDPQDGPAILVSRRETEAIIHRAIAELDEDANQVVVLKDIEGLRYEEIAEILNCPVGSVKSRLHRARTRLREILQDLVQDR